MSVNLVIRERPILFNGDMVRAILEGRKTQTRRIVKNQPCGGWAFDGVYGRITSPHPQRGKFGAFLRRGVGTSWPELGILPCPYGSPEDQLWVKETFAEPNDQVTIYRANWREDAITRGLDNIPKDDSGIRWKPSIYMPRWASRITLEITNIRVERLNDISEEDAIAEGIERESGEYEGYFRDYREPDAITKHARLSYMGLWESINGAGSWGINPWVWVIEFRKLEGGAL